MPYPYMGIPATLQQAFDKMTHARDHIELGKAYEDSAVEIVRVRNSGAFNDQVMHEFFQAHNAIYMRMAQRFPCAPKTTNEFVLLESLLLTPHPRFTRGWLEWSLSGQYNSPVTQKHRNIAAPMIERWTACEYIRPIGNGEYVIGEEGKRLQSALKVGKRFPTWAAVGMI